MKRLFPPSLAILIIAAANLFADELYVSTSGSNQNPGTLERPSRDIDFAADRADPGDTILVMGGAYH